MVEKVLSDKPECGSICQLSARREGLVSTSRKDIGRKEPDRMWYRACMKNALSDLGNSGAFGLTVPLSAIAPTTPHDDACPRDVPRIALPL